MMKHFVIAAIVMLGCVQQGVCAGYLAVPRTDRELRIDGLVTPRERSACSMTTLTAAGTMRRPRHETTIYACATGSALYLGFVCDDPVPQALVTSVTQENGPVMTDDSVEAIICPALIGERDNYFHFAMNAAGVRYSWDARFDRPVEGWQGKASVTPAGWEAEFLIPFQSVRGRTDISHWRGNFERNRPARPHEPAEVSVWVDPGMTIHNYRSFGFLRFVEPTEDDLEKLVQQLMELRQGDQSGAAPSTVPQASDLLSTATVTATPAPPEKLETSGNTARLGARAAADAATSVTRR
jgi:hypothetical protein